MKKSLRILIPALVAIFSVYLFCGVYAHDEFGGNHFFIKHRPILKWKFYSPTGMSDLELKDLSEEKRREQILFDEFIRDQGLSR